VRVSGQEAQAVQVKALAVEAVRACAAVDFAPRTEMRACTPLLQIRERIYCMHFFSTDQKEIRV